LTAGPVDHPVGYPKVQERLMTTNLSTSLITKLTVANKLDGEDIQAIQRLPIRVRNMKAREVIVRDGERPTECCLLADGFAFRAETTEDGERQVLLLHIPGEIPDLQSLHLKVMDHDLMTLTPCVLGFIAHEKLIELIGHVQRSRKRFGEKR
jgi:CRP-like cAMP-binding protein